MMIKVKDEFLEFDGDIIVEKQIFNYSTLETAGTFSYSFTIPPTSSNRKKLGLLNINNNEVVCLVDDVQLLTESGIPLYLGYILVDDPLGIECSFFSDNNNFFTSIEGSVNELNSLSKYDSFIDEAHIVDSWTADNGVVFPLVDRGGVWRRKDPFMKLRIRRGRVDQNDWQPFIYVRNVMDAILQKANLKMDGDLINSGTYHNLITTNGSPEISKKIIKKQEIFVGSKTVQTIPNGSANAVKIQFDLHEALPFYNSELKSFDPVLNRWITTYDVTFRMSIAGRVSDASKSITWSFINAFGANAGNRFTKALAFDFNTDTGFLSNEPSYINAANGLELWAFVDPATPGTVDITEITMKVEVGRTYTVIAQSLIPSLTSREFISDIFKMFNIIATFDQTTRTIHTRFMQRINQFDVVDLSKYVHEIQALRNTELISELSQSNVLKYSPFEGSEQIDIYNQTHPLEYGAGDLEIKNSKLKKQDDLIELKFKAPYVYRHEGFGLYLVRLDFIAYEDATQDIDTTNGKQTITSVTDNAGLAQFNTAAAITYIARNNFFAGDATGLGEGIGGGLSGFNTEIDRTSQYQENENDNQIICIYLKDVDLPHEFNFTQNTSIFYDQWGIIRISNMSNPVYDGDWESRDADVEMRSSVGVAIFSKAVDGTPLDLVRQGLSFGDIDGLNSLTLKESFYRITESGLNNPIKPIIQMLIPENVFINLDFTKAIRLETENLNGVFLINKCTGYKDSKTPCTFELIKITV